MKMNLANKLTIFRIILVPVMAIIPYLNLKGDFLGLPLTYFFMELIFIVASITDKLDGYIARKKSSHNIWEIFRPISRQNSSINCHGIISGIRQNSSMDSNYSTSKRIYSVRL